MRVNGLLMSACVVTALVSVGVAGADDPSMGRPPDARADGVELQNGVIGVSLQVGAERIGDPAVLYVGMVHPEGPAHQAGLKHGDEILTVDGTAVAGKTYEQAVRMIRGEAGTAVKLVVKGEAGQKEYAVTRVAGDKLAQGPKGSHGGVGR